MAARSRLAFKSSGSHSPCVTRRSNSATLSAPLRIGMVLYPSLGGSGTVAIELARHMVRLGHVVHIFSMDVPFATGRLNERETSRLVFHRVEVPAYPLFVHAPYTLALANKLAEVAQADRLDVIHVHYAVPHAAAAVFAKAMVFPAPLPVIATLHGTDVTLTGKEPTLRKAVGFSLQRCDAVTAVSRALAQEAEKAFGLQGIEVIPNFVDVRLLRPRPASRIREALAKPHEAILFHASNFRRVKNALDVAEIFVRVARTRPSVLVLCGDGPDAGSLLSRLHAAGLDRKVRFLGVQADLHTVMAVADAFLLPSTGEGFGLAALEAMAAGVPVIGTDVGGLPEVVESGKTGFLLPVHDVDGMAEATLKALQPTQRTLMGHLARARAARLFSHSRVVPRYVQLYHQVLGRQTEFPL